MALTQEQQEVFDAVIASLRTNSKTIEQMTPQTSLGSADWFELNGGRKVSYDVLKTLIASLTSSEIDSLKIALKKTDNSLNLLFDNLDKDFVRGIEVAESEAGVKLVLKQYDPVDDGVTEEEVAVPLAGAAQVASLKKQVEDIASNINTASRVFLSVNTAGELVAHGVSKYIEQGMTPVLFRRLRRSNRRTDNKSRTVDKRWTRLTKYADAVSINAKTGVLSFSTDLLDESGRTDRDNVLHSTNPSALILSLSGKIVYGKTFFSLDAPDNWRMLVFDFVLGFVDLNGETPARRWMLSDTPVRLPFRVRFTPTFEYESDNAKEVMLTANAHFGFQV